MTESNLRGTKWRHRRNGELVGELVLHRPLTGRIGLCRPDGSIYRGRIGNLRKNWEQVPSAEE